MKANITHIAIYTMDPERLRVFYQKYFDAESNAKYENDKGFSSYFLSFTHGAKVEIMSHTELEDREVIEKVTGLSHIAFSVGTKENVIALTERIVGDGYTLLSQPRNTGDGFFESCIADPDGNRVEITI